MGHLNANNIEYWTKLVCLLLFVVVVVPAVAVVAVVVVVVVIIIIIIYLGVINDPVQQTKQCICKRIAPHLSISLMELFILIFLIRHFLVARLARNQINSRLTKTPLESVHFDGHQSQRQ